MSNRGVLHTWKDEKGFGFIRPAEGGTDVFLHISAVQDAARRPQAGDKVIYRLAVGIDGRTRALDARLEGVAQGTRWNPFPLVLVVFCFVASCLFFLRTHYPLPLLYLVMSAITYALYEDDKSRAKQNAYRIPEATLHLLELIGGWPGGYIAQQKLRHKTVKLTYQISFWGIVLIHTILWGWWLRNDW